MGRGGKLVLSVESSMARVCVRIQDNGPGIPHEQLSKLGQPFFTTKATGTGIGLMIAYRLIEELGGKITVESTMGEGTVFQVCLPHQTDAAVSLSAPGSVAVSS